MNLLTMITCASAFASYMTAPINNYNTSSIKNITNSKIQSNISVGIKKITECYNGYLYVDFLRIKNILNFIKKASLPKEKCKDNTVGCYISISWFITSTYKKKGKTLSNSIFSGCDYYKDDREFFLYKQTNWIQYFIDYDSHDTFFTMIDYCESDLCNSLDLENLPHAKELLSIKAKGYRQHDVLCPGYSKNYRKINMEIGISQEISVAKGSNLILIAKGIINQWPLSYFKPPVLPYSNSPYDKTEWTLATLENPDNDMPFISFDKDDNVITYDIQHDLIVNNKIFYRTPKSIHICNFTKEDQGIFKHIDKFENNKSLVYEVKIIVRKEPTTISTTKGDYTSSSVFSSDITQQVSTRIKTTDYTLLLLSSTKNASYKNINTYKQSHNENDNIKYIAGSVASGLILVIVTITIYCVIKYKKGKQHAINTKNEFMLIPLK
jgi:hypothetical protein